MKFRPEVAALCALLTPLPIVWFNPDFARAPVEWFELTAGVIALTLLAAAVGATVWRLRGTSPSAGAWWATRLWLASTMATAGGIVAGATGAVLAVLPLGVGSLVMLAQRRSVPRRPARVTIISTVVAAALLVACVTSVGRPEAPEHQLVMIGLDGAAWPIIDRLRREGRLPTFDRLVTQGARGDLDTLSPILSPPIWTSIASGKSPDRHGVKDFWTSADHVRSKRIWEIADEHGLLSGVVGYLVTWPPRKQKGFLVPGWLAQGPETVPPELSFLKRLGRLTKPGVRLPISEMVSLIFMALRHGMTISTVNTALAFVLPRGLSVQSELDRALSVPLTKFGLTTDVFCHLVRQLQPDLAIYYESSIDAVQHLFFKYYEPARFAGVTPDDANRYGDAIPRMYEAADEAIAKITSASSSNATVLVVSDHGQEAAGTEGEQWYTINTKSLLRHLGIASGLRATNTGTAVFLRATVPPAGSWRVPDKIRSVVTVPDGEPIFRVEERNPGEALLRVRPGLDLSSAVRVRLGKSEAPVTTLLEPSGRVSGVHTNTAILLLAGPDIVQGRVLPRAHILDVAPTVLALLRLPVARDMQGRVIEEAIRGDLRASIPVGYVETFGAPDKGSIALPGQTLDESTEEKLRMLGYVD